MKLVRMVCECESFSSLPDFSGGWSKRHPENVIWVSVLTKATKQVEAAISNEVWDRQRQWEMKRDALLEAAQHVAREDAMPVRLDSVMTVKAKQKDGSDRVQAPLTSSEHGK